MSHLSTVLLPKENTYVYKDLLLKRSNNLLGLILGLTCYFAERL